MKRFKHTLSNYRLLTCDMGQLIPIGLQETLPGDTFQISTSAMIRVSPLAAPVMHPVNVRIHHFFVPHRLVWSGWEDFITGGPDGMNTASPPDITATLPITSGSLWDFLGVPRDQGTGSIVVQTMPLMGINKIWNEYYRDQDLQAERAETDSTIPFIGWGKDYFTAARPWAQKGPEITLPIGTQAPIVGIGINPQTGAVWTNGLNVRTVGGGAETWRGFVNQTAPAQAIVLQEDPDHTGAPGVYADLSQAGQINITDFRRGFALQRYQEARARYGSRYTEYLRYLGVTPSDARLQRPEYLGGGTARLNFSEVLQTAEPTDIAPPTRESFGVGDLYGHGIAGLRHGRIRRFIEEHGYIHSFLSVRPKGIYMNGIHRTFLRRTKEDFWQRELEHIGQQSVLNSELYMQGGATGLETFGYADRYAEYRSTPSLVCGEFRDLLDYWHMGRQLPDTTTLNEDFIKCVPTKRIHNVQTTNALWCMINNHVVARRLVSKSTQSYIL